MVIPIELKVIQWCSEKRRQVGWSDPSYFQKRLLCILVLFLYKECSACNLRLRWCTCLHCLRLAIDAPKRCLNAEKVLPIIRNYIILPSYSNLWKEKTHQEALWFERTAPVSLGVASCIPTLRAEAEQLREADASESNSRKSMQALDGFTASFSGLGFAPVIWCHRIS